MSYFSNQNLQANGSPITHFGVLTKDDASTLVAQQGYQDFSTLSSFVELDPMKNMMLLESAWDNLFKTLCIQML